MEFQTEEKSSVARHVTLLVTKHHKNQDDKEDGEAAITAMRNIETIVIGWYDKSIIAGVKDMHEEKTIATFQDCNLHLSEARVSGRYASRVEIYFTIDTMCSTRELIEEDLSFLRKENIRLEDKRTDEEHVNKIEYLSRPIVNSAKMNWHDEMMQSIAETEKGQVEIKKGPVCEGHEESRCIAAHSIRSVSDHIDFKLRKMSAESDRCVKYVSFKHSSKKERIASLQLNKLLNGPNNHKGFENMQVLAPAQFKGKNMPFSQVIIRAKTNGIYILNGVEQGSNMNKNRVCVYFKPNTREEAREWIQKNYGKDFKVKDNIACTTSLLVVKPEETKVNNEMQDYI